MSSIWAYEVTSMVTLDNLSPVTLNLTGPESGVTSSVVWGVGQLLDGSHTLIVSRAPGGTYVEVDAIMYVCRSHMAVYFVTHELVESLLIPAIPRTPQISCQPTPRCQIPQTLSRQVLNVSGSGGFASVYLFLHSSIPNWIIGWRVVPER